MAKAGWCRECGEWIWVDEEGSCQHGHGGDCVDGVHEVVSEEPPQLPVGPGPLPSHASIERGMGAGEMPDALDRFNWGAFLLPLFWSIAYGVWPIVSIWLLTLLFPDLLLAIAGPRGREDALLPVSIAAQVVYGAAVIWIGANANRMLWKRERRRLELVEGASPRITVSRFLERQRTWTIVGASLTVLSLIGVAVLTFDMSSTGNQLREQLGVTPLLAGMSAGWLFAQLALAAWMARKMREDGSRPEGPAEDPV